MAEVAAAQGSLDLRKENSMNPYSQSLDVVRLQRDLRRLAGRRVVVRAWSRWGDPLLAGVVLALIAWALVDGQTAQPPDGASALVAESRSFP